MQKKMVCIHSPRTKGLGNRGVGLEMAIVTLLVLALMSMLIVSTSMGNVKLQRLKNDYNLKRTAIQYLAENYVCTIQRGLTFSENEFRETHLSFTSVYPETKAYTQQSISTEGNVTTFTLYLKGISGTQHLKVQLIRTKSGNTFTYATTCWEVNPNG